MSVNILLADDHKMIREGLKQLLEMYDDIKADDGSIYTYYEYTCPITGYSIEADFKDGTFCRELVNSAEECRAVYNAHGITDTVCSFDRLMKLSNS